MRIGFSFLFILMLAATARPQQPWTQERPDEREQTVVNEDGGRAFLIKPAATPLQGILKPGSADEIAEVEQRSIFLGSGWASPALRSQEPQLSSLLAVIREHAQMDELSQAGITNLFGPTTCQEKVDVTSDRNIADLEIQNILAGMIAEGSLARPNAGTVYLIFLDSGLHSTLGSLMAGKHYIAYHNFLNTSGAKIHYVVVPFQPDPKTAYQVALRALVVAALNPVGSSN